MSRRSAERRCARPEMSEAGVQTCLKYAGPVSRIQSKAVAATLYIDPLTLWQPVEHLAEDWSDVLKFPGTDDKPGSSVQDHL